MKKKRGYTVIISAVLILTFIGFVSAIGGIHHPGRLNTSQELSDRNKPPQKPAVEAVVIVHSGDTLWTIMRSHYGNDVHGQKAVCRIR